METAEMTRTKRVPTLRFGGFKDDWSSVPLENVLELKSGYIFKSETYVEGGRYRVVTIANVQDGWMSFERVSTVDELPENIRDFQVLQRGDILISLTGNVGRVCLVDTDDCLLNQRVGKLVPKSNVNKDLLYQVLRNEEFLSTMVEQAQGGAQDNLSSKDVLGYKVALPTLPEQQKIAAFLGAVDRKIQQLKRKQALLVQYKKGVVQQLFSQELRFKIRTKAGELVEPPEWEEKRLGDVLNYEQPTKYIVQSTEYSDVYPTPVLTAGKTFILGYTDETNGIHRSDQPVIIFDDFTTANKFVDFPFKVKSSAMKILSCDPQNASIKFVYEAMQQIDYVVGDHKRHWISIFEDIEIPFPCLQEQSRIAGFLMAMDAKVAGVAQAVAAAQRWKKGLLQQMFV